MPFCRLPLSYSSYDLFCDQILPRLWETLAKVDDAAIQLTPLGILQVCWLDVVIGMQVYDSATAHVRCPPVLSYCSVLLVALSLFRL
jgi:hypothetical protein